MRVRSYWADFGVCYRRGLGVTPDDTKAEHCYRSAAQKGNVSAQLALGDLLNQSDLTERIVESISWYRQAANAGNRNAIVRLGQMYEVGRGVAASAETALDYFRQAADLGDHYAESRLQAASTNIFD